MRVCFERHATSKYDQTELFFFTYTKEGFRGEALASIAAIARNGDEDKTRPRKLRNLGIIVEGNGFFLSQDMAVLRRKALIAVKTLLFNITRRNFLRSDDTVEYRHIMRSVQRVRFSAPNIYFFS
jgi:DNA mismatch repair ATPase MutL